MKISPEGMEMMNEYEWMYDIGLEPSWELAGTQVGNLGLEQCVEQKHRRPCALSAWD